MEKPYFNFSRLKEDRGNTIKVNKETAALETGSNQGPDEQTVQEHSETQPPRLGGYRGPTKARSF